MTLADLRNLRLNREKPASPLLVRVDGREQPDELVCRDLNPDLRPLAGLTVYVYFRDQAIKAVCMAHKLDSIGCIVFLKHATGRQHIYNGDQEPNWTRLKQWLSTLYKTTSI